MRVEVEHVEMCGAIAVTTRELVEVEHIVLTQGEALEYRWPGWECAPR